MPLPGEALAPHGAFLTSRESSGANERPELHECLIVGPGGATGAWQEATRDAPDLALTGGSLEVGVGRERATEDARDVGVHEFGAPLVRERCHGPGGVVADARQLAQTRGVRRERLVRRSAALGDVAGEAVQVPSARVVTEAVPRFTDLTRSRAREVHKGGEALEEAIVVVENA